MAGLHELYGVKSAQELLSRLRPPRERRSRRIRVDRDAIREQLEKEGVPRWDVDSVLEEHSAAGDTGASNRGAAADERNVNEEIPEIPIPAPIEMEKQTSPDRTDEQELLASSIRSENDEIVESTPIQSPVPQLTSTPTRHILPVPSRRRVALSPGRNEDEGSVSQASQGLEVQQLLESSVAAGSQSATAPTVTSRHDLSEETELLVRAEHHARQPVVEEPKRVQAESRNDEEMQGDHEVWLLDIGAGSRPASSVTDLDVAMTVVKRVCLDYGRQRKSREEREAIRSFYRHVKNVSAKAIGELRELRKVQQTLNKLKRDNKKQLEQIVSLERRKVKIDSQVKDGRKNLNELKDKRKNAESCLNFLKKLEHLKQRLQTRS